MKYQINLVWTLEIRVASGWKIIRLMLGGDPIKTNYLSQFAKLEQCDINDLRIKRVRTTVEYFILENDMDKSTQWIIEPEYENWLNFNDGSVRKLAAPKFKKENQ